MKKNFFLLSGILLLAMALMSSCTEPKPEPEPDPEETWLTVLESSLAFPATGGIKTLNVSSSSGEWDVTSESTWISIGDPDFENGTVKIAVTAFDSDTDVTGTITITSGTDEKTVDVTQKGWGAIIHERSSLARMNLKGDIAELEYYVNPVYLIEIRFGEMRNLKFNEKGMLTYYECKNKYNDEYIPYHNTLTYDNSGRLIKLESVSPGFVADGTSTPIAYTLDFEYGSHDKYVEMEQIMDYLDSGLLCIGYHRLWMPHMIKGLTKIKGNNNAIAPTQNFQFELEADGNAIAVKFVAFKDSDGSVDETQGVDLGVYTYDGPYVIKREYIHVLFGMMPSPTYSDYVIDPASGNMLSKKTYTLYYDGYEAPIISATHFDNRINMWENYINLLVGYDMDVVINDNKDVTSLDNVATASVIELAYVYDEQGNWTRIEATKLENLTHLDWYEMDRKIIYR